MGIFYFSLVEQRGVWFDCFSFFETVSRIDFQFVENGNAFDEYSYSFCQFNVIFENFFLHSSSNPYDLRSRHTFTNISKQNFLYYMQPYT